jgi:hypothetical protein
MVIHDIVKKADTFYLAITAPCWRHQNADRYNEIMVKKGDVYVWDDVADYYTSVHTAPVDEILKACEDYKVGDIQQ